LISLHEGLLQVKFIGSFCHTCGFYDYFDDFIIVLEELGLIAKVREINGEAIVKFKLRRLV